MYEPFNAANEIAGLKNQWDTGDENAKKRAAKKAQGYYDDLRKNGYGELADKLSGSNTGEARAIVDGLKTSGKSPMRKTVTDTLTGVYGLSEKDANDRISWDQNSGDVYLGSYNLGPGDAFVSGTHYTADRDKLLNNVKDYARDAGLYPSAETNYNIYSGKAADTYDLGVNAVNRAMETYNKTLGWIGDDRTDVQNMISDYNDWVSTPYTDTKEYDRFMKQYADIGEKAGWSALAGSAGSNGGNIDSYAQAQAQRQYNSLLSQGDAAARAWYQAEKDNRLGAIKTLIDYNNGIYDVNNFTAGEIAGLQGLYNASGNRYADLANNYFDNWQTALDNELDRAEQQQDILDKEADRRGTLSLQDIYDMYPFFNSNGSFNTYYNNYDFRALIDQAEAEGNEEMANIYKMARNAKIDSDPESYGQYGYEVVDYRLPTEAARRFDRTDATNRYAIDVNADVEKYGYDTEKHKSDNQLASDKYGYDVERHASDNAAKIAYANNKSAEDINTANINANYALARENNQAKFDLAALNGNNNAGTQAKAIKGSDIEKGFRVNSDGKVLATAAARKHGVDDNGAMLIQRVYNEYMRSGLTEEEIDRAVRYNSNGLALTQAETDNVKAYLYSLI
ncbi:MAG: hypothetical protein J1F63_04910 [Oscillospiraceae bacterium]|nr:hypothetical protein [Oscillospiraceae bacterium]